MIDTTCPWTVAEALAIGQELEDLNLHWFEEPVWPPETTAASRSCGGKACIASPPAKMLAACMISWR